MAAADKENGIFATREVTPSPRGPRKRIRLVGGKFVGMSYRQHILVEDHGFILGQRMTHSTAREAEPLLELLSEAPVRVRILTADTGYSLGMLGRELESRGIEAHIPLHTRHIENRRRREGFRLRGPRELVCPAGKTLKRSTYYKRDEAWLYAARVNDRRACPRRPQCLPPCSKRRFVQLSEYEPEFDRSTETNATVRHRRLTRRRKTVIEGVFARLDRLGFRRTRRRGLGRVQAESSIVAFVHNVLKATRHMSRPHEGAASSRPPRLPGIVHAVHAPGVGRKLAEAFSAVP